MKKMILRLNAIAFAAALLGVFGCPSQGGGGCGGSQANTPAPLDCQSGYHQSGQSCVPDASQQKPATTTPTANSNSNTPQNKVQTMGN